MKKLSLGLLLLLGVGGNSLFAQNYDKVRDALTVYGITPNDAKLEEAKTEIDKLLTQPKAQSKAETYALKTEVYGMIASAEKLLAKYPTAGADALAALKKYLEMDPTGAKYKEDNLAGINGVYSSFFNEGIKNYNAKSWDAAFQSFKTVVEVRNILTKQSWANTFDTTAYQLAGASAQNAGKDNEAAEYYEKLAALKIKGKDFEYIYDFLPVHYIKTKEEAKFKHALAVGKEVYPEKTYWNDLEFEYTTSNLTLDELTKQFESDLSANKLTATTAANYGGYFFNDKKIKDLSPEQRKKYTALATSAFEKAAELDPNNTLNAFNVALCHYVNWEEVSDSAQSIKGITPEIKAKRAKADKVAWDVSEKAVTALEKAYKLLDAKATKEKLEKSSQSNAAKYLANLYMWKRDKSKGKAADYDMYDKKFQTYDKLY